MENKDNFLHAEYLVLNNHNKHIRGIYKGLNTVSVNHLIGDIKVLKEELDAEIKIHLKLIIYQATYRASLDILMQV